MPDVMIDLETMGQGPDAAIVAIGAVAFNLATRELGPEHYYPVDLASAVQSGGVMDPGTVLWWLRQGNEARAALTGPVGYPLGYALSEFAAWLNHLGAREDLRLWGNGAGFDNVILASAYRRVGLPTPWDWWNDRCYRTVKALHRHITVERQGTAHNALDDARHQAEHLLAILSPAKVEHG
jgi:exodeoxyribonuclease VIII